MHNARLLMPALTGSALLACSFATSFDDIEGEPSPAAIADASLGADSPDDTGETGGDAANAESDADAAPVITEYIPGEGRYSYESSGEESVTVSGLQNGTSGPRMENGAFVADLVHVDGTHWSWSGTLSSQHAERYDFEAKDSKLSEWEGRLDTGWEIPTVNHYDSVIKWDCSKAPNLLLDRAKPDGLPVLTQVCGGAGYAQGAVIGPFSLGGAYTFVGAESIMVGGVTVNTLHYTQSRTATGSNIVVPTTFTVDWYFRESDGLPIKQKRAMDFRQTNVFFTVVQTDNASWTLSSLTPKPLPVVDAGVTDSGIADSGIKDAAKGQ